MNSTTSKYLFYEKLKPIVYTASDLETEFPFISFSEYTTPITHSKFVIYEDWWLANPEIVLAKIGAIKGANKRIFARKTTVKKINKLQADAFLSANHLHGTVKVKHKLGLFYNTELVAVATFSAQRNLEVGRSAELIRFCSLIGTTITGGLDKLLKFYEREYQPDHIMTYIDKDWGSGSAFVNLGFTKTADKEPIQFCVDRTTGVRKLVNSENENCELKVMNRGSGKLEKYC